jgi:hypothetical protein
MGRKQTLPVWAQFGDIRVGNVSIISHRFSLLPVASRLECPKVTNPRFLAVHSLTHIAKNLQSRIRESPTRARVKELRLVTSRKICSRARARARGPQPRLFPCTHVPLLGTQPQHASRG